MRRRYEEREHRSGCRVLETEAATFGFCERTRERKPDAMTVGARSTPLEDALRVADDAWALVADFDRHARSGGSRVHGDDPTAVMQRVVEEDVEDLSHRPSFSQRKELR